MICLVLVGWFILDSCLSFSKSSDRPVEVIQFPLYVSMLLIISVGFMLLLILSMTGMWLNLVDAMVDVTVYLYLSLCWCDCLEGICIFRIFQAVDLCVFVYFCHLECIYCHAVHSFYDLLSINSLISQSPVV